MHGSRAVSLLAVEHTLVIEGLSVGAAYGSHNFGAEAAVKAVLRVASGVRNTSTCTKISNKKTKVVTIIKDKDLNLKKMIKKINIIDNNTAPRRKESQPVEEYFDEILDEKISQLIKEPSRVCLEPPVY